MINSFYMKSVNTIAFLLLLIEFTWLLYFAPLIDNKLHILSVSKNLCF